MTASREAEAGDVALAASVFCQSLPVGTQGQCMGRKEEEKAQLICVAPPQGCSRVFTPAQHAALTGGLHLNSRVLSLGLLCWPLPLERQPRGNLRSTVA